MEYYLQEQVEGGSYQRADLVALSFTASLNYESIAERFGDADSTWFTLTHFEDEDQAAKVLLAYRESSHVFTRVIDTDGRWYESDPDTLKLIDLDNDKALRLWRRNCLRAAMARNLKVCLQQTSQSAYRWLESEDPQALAIVFYTARTSALGMIQHVNEGGGIGNKASLLFAQKVTEATDAWASTLPPFFEEQFAISADEVARSLDLYDSATAIQGR